MKQWWRIRQQRRQGHAKAVAYVAERAERVAARAHAILAKHSPRSVPPSPPPRKRGWFSALNEIRLGFVPVIKPANDNSDYNLKPWHNSRRFEWWLEKKKFKKLGAGWHSSVWGHDKSNRVIKIGHLADGWINYVMWGRAHGYEGKFTPRVFSYKWYDGGFYVAVMERLKRTTNHGTVKDRDRCLLELFSLGRNGNDAALVALDTIEPGAAKFTLDIKEAANDNKWGWDDHADNFMIREDESWVAIDPVNIRAKPRKERIRAA